jgi:DNA-binding CsgD family transcriptional regulator
MADKTFLTWPFFEERHRALAEDLEVWCATHLETIDHSDTDNACRALVAGLGEAGFLRHSAVGLDVRGLCLIRETLARHDGLADFAFAMQGLGTGAISLFGTEAQKRRWLTQTRAGAAISAFALTEPQSGSDVAASTLTAEEDGDDFILNGEKTWISNGGIADVYTLFARTGEGPGAKGLSAFVVPAGLPGFEVVERLEVIAPHPLGRLRFTDCRIPKDALLGARGQGFKIAMSVLDVFRSSVAAAALGFARRALDEALTRVTERASWSFLGGFGEGLSLGGAIDGAGSTALPAYVDGLRHNHTHTDYPSALPKNTASDHSGHVHLFGLHEPVFAVLFLITPHHNIDFTPSAIRLLKHAVELCLSKGQGGHQQHNHHQPAAPVGGSFFSERQIQVLGLLAEGLSNTEIGRKLSISASLAKQEVAFLMHSLGARSRLDAVVQAQKNGLLPV